MNKFVVILFLILGKTFCQLENAVDIQTIDIISKNGNLIIKNTEENVNIKGINYFGLQSFVHTVHGLWVQNLEYLLDFLQENKFNAIRLPFSMDMIINTQIKPSYQSIDYTKNPNLDGLSSIQVIDYVIARAAERCMLVLLDFHVFNGGDSITELWYNTVYTENLIILGWQSLATRYLNQWNVMGCDLKNEPHGIASWGDNNLATDWRLAAERIGNAILEINPKLLIFVEGVQDRSFPPTNLPWGNSGNQWGGGLSSAAVSPVQLNIPEKLVYTAHVYGPDVGAEIYFTDPTFPDNMPDIWDEQWAYLSRTNYTLIIGEFGGKEIEGTLDRVWSNKIKTWLVEKNMTNNFFWGLNPNSVDTAGLLFDDWTTPDLYKLAILQEINPNPTNMCILYSTLPLEPPGPPLEPPPGPPLRPPPGPPGLPPVPSPTTGPMGYFLQTPFVELQTWFQQSWTDGLNNSYYKYNGSLTNINMPVITEAIMPCTGCNVSQYWNCNYNYITNVFSLFNSIKYSGGLRKTQVMTFGIITVNSYFNLTLGVTHGPNG